MNILVTGGAGFVGSSLVERLIAEDHVVDVIDDLSTGTLRNLSDARARRTGTLKIHQCDILDDGVDSLIARRPPDVVYHLASSTGRGQQRPGLADSLSVDVVGALQVLESAVAAGATKFVLAARARARTTPGLRGVASRALVDMVIEARETLGIEATVLEFATVYGPRQRPGTESSVVATFADRLRRGAPCVIHGSGEQVRDLVFVDDAVDALARAASVGDGLAIEVGTGRGTTIAELYRAMASILSFDEEPVPGAHRSDDAESVVVDPARAAMYLDWEPFTPLAEGLTETLLADGVGV